MIYQWHTVDTFRLLLLEKPNSGLVGATIRQLGSESFRYEAGGHFVASGPIMFDTQEEAIRAVEAGVRAAGHSVEGRPAGWS